MSFGAKYLALLADTLSRYRTRIYFMSVIDPNSVPADTHVVEVREESYGFTMAHRLDGVLLYVATYPNRMEAMRNARRFVDTEEAEGHTVVLSADSRLG